MSNSVLQIFLDNQFIKTDDVSNIESLGKASVAIQKLLKQKKNRPRVIQFTLVALDPTMSWDDPIVGEVEKLIIKYWSTFRNSVANTNDTPYGYIQAVILDALDKLSKDDDFAALIWHAGCNIVSHYKLAGQKDVIRQFLTKIGVKVESVARQNWNILEGAVVENVELEKAPLPALKAGSVNEENLKSHLMAASAQISVGGTNPQWPTTQNAQWPTHFSQHAAAGISEEVNKALNDQSSSIKSVARSLHEAVNTYLATTKPYLDNAIKSVIQSTETTSKRSQLLWWKQSLFSQRLDTGYRTLDSIAVAITMLIDLADQVAPIYPRSVDYFLGETLKAVLGDESARKVDLSELLAQARELPDNQKELLTELQNDNPNRRMLGECVADFVLDRISYEDLCQHVGIDKKCKISLNELAVWLFHDLHATTLARTH